MSTQSPAPPRLPTPDPANGSSQPRPSPSSSHLSLDPMALAGARAVAGRYHVVKAIGQTSAAWVYRAIHTGLAVPCFLKVAEADPSQPQGVPERLRREARASASVRHPALLRVYDAGTWEGRAYLAQEWVEGPSLRELINRGSVVTVPEVLAVALDLLDGVSALHKRGIVVRALEPERIFVRETPEKREAKIFDLSRCHFLGEGGPPPAAERTHASKGGAGIVVQSARYLSPEEIRELPPDPRSDLYSFGLVLYEMLTGEFPYANKAGAGPTAWIVSHLREVPRPLALPPERGSVPEDLPGIIRRLLAKRPEDRFQTAESARRALEDTVIPDLMRHSSSSGSRVLDGWRSRVRGMLQTRDGFVSPASEDAAS